MAPARLAWFPGAMSQPPCPWWRHVARCNDLASPASFTPFLIDGQQVGWLADDVVRALTFRPASFHFDQRGVSLAGRLRSAGARSAALEDAVAALVAAGLIPRLRGERYDIRAAKGSASLATIDRSAVPAFGVRAEGVHVNGLVRRADGLHLWVAVRAADKAVEPGKCDNVVAGGIPAGLGPQETLIKEAAEEASIPPELAATARKVATLSYVMAWDGPRQARGMRRDTLHVYDLDLPETFVPRPHDNEVQGFELWPIARVAEAVRETDMFKFNVNLVLIDLFLRLGLIPPGPAAERLRAGLDQG
jgi:8-oxo-dGTP pyrophosphatase MutT (NUDIX family)